LAENHHTDYFVPEPHHMSAKKLPGNEFQTRELTVLNKSGIHARPAAMFVKIANRFGSEIFVEKDGEKINGKSIMGLMMLAAGPGSKVTLHVKGADADAAIAELEALVNRKFGED
jgi:phosphocarrier protein